MNWCGRLLAMAIVTSLIGGSLSAGEKKAPKEESSFGLLKSAGAEEAQKQSEAWLRETARKTDTATLASFQKVWASDRALTDKVADTLALGNADAARLLAEARNPVSPAPLEVPALLKDTKVPAFFRANLGLAYAKALTTRRVYEEALETFAAVKVEDVVDPSSYLFHKAVCEHALLLKDNADGSIDRLLVDAADAPERYRMVAALMHFDMVTWQEKDLAWIARKMDNIQRRLDLKRGGKQTQKIQKEVLVRLDEMIKELENKKKCNGSCPNGGPGQDAPGTQPQSSSPQNDTKGGTASGKGEVDKKKVEELAAVWGVLPEKERTRMLAELTRGMPSKDRSTIEAYFKELQKKALK